MHSRYHRITLNTLLLLASPALLAQSFTPPVDPFVTEEVRQQQRVTPLESGDERKQALQRQRIDELAAEHLGRHLADSRDNDLDILQALLDQQVIRTTDSYLLQAMGVVLGDIYAREFNLVWVNYSDSQGKSRALQLQGSDVLFPITMISRRVETGSYVNVREIYQKGVAIIQDYRQPSRY